MEIEPDGPSVKKMKLAAALETHQEAPPPPTGEAPDPIPTTTTEDQEPPPGAGPGGDGEWLDRISNLPDEVLCEIIFLLPTKDGARTQALASRWRHLWRAAPLNLDYRGFRGDGDSDGDEDVLPGIILSAHHAPCRRLCLPAHHFQSQADTVDAWLRSPAIDNLQELEFYAQTYRPDTLTPLPASAFRFSSTLRVATISQCHIPEDTVKMLHFQQLKKLALVQVNISDDSLHGVIAGCPGLECLLLREIIGFRCLRINSPGLRSIAMTSKSRELIIEDAPSLQRLLNFTWNTDLQVSVISAPKLETLGYLDDWHSFSTVTLGSAVIQGILVDNLTTAVRNVKILALKIYIFDLDKIIGLMTLFPCLEKLYMKNGGSGHENFWRRKHLKFRRSHEIRLKKIVMGSYRGINAQVSFATFFILNARALESMTFEVEARNYSQRFCARARKRLDLDNRASRDARFYFTKGCRHDASYRRHVNDLELADPFQCGCGEQGLEC